MEQSIGVIMGFGLWLAAVAMFYTHRKHWLAAKHTLPAGEERTFRLGLFRRRFLMSLLLSLLGFGVMLGQFIPAEKHPVLFSGLWITLTLLTLWVIILSLLDLTSIRRHGLSLSRQLLEEHAKLEAEMRQKRLRHELGEQNGHTNHN